MNIATQSQIDIIFVDTLTLDARIGVHPHEKAGPQPIHIDLELHMDTRPAARSDNLDDTVDYAAITSACAQLCLSHHFELVETLAQHIADLCLMDERVQQVSVRIAKPQAITLARGVGVHIVRTRQSSNA